MSYFCLNLGQTAEDSDMFAIIWLRPRGLNLAMFQWYVIALYPGLRIKFVAIYKVRDLSESIVA